MAEEAAAAVDEPATTGSDPPASSGRALVRHNSSVQNWPKASGMVRALA